MGEKGHNSYAENLGVIDTSCVQSGFSLKVNQHHYVTWPDHDVPLVTSLVDFWCSVSTAYRGHPQPAGPLLVHCRWVSVRYRSSFVHYMWVRILYCSSLVHCM